ncbi:MAG: TonB-dependent receptor [Tunicatimonas sp.]
MKCIFTALAAGRSFLIALTLGLLAQTALAQTVQVTVTDEDRNPLPGVNVVIEGTTQGTTTDVAGEARLTAPSDATLVLSFIGYARETVAVDGRSAINVQMQPDLSELQEVVVIGSRNQNRTVTETPVPVDVIPLQEMLESAPQVEITQILNYIAPSFSSNRQTISDGTDHVDPASLRGLGVDHVLVLVNGKRRHNSSLVNVNGTVGRGSVGTDLNSIPAAAIERIEVLRDGAAAQYGSDAIAGVINLVLKETTDQVFFSATGGQMYEGDGEVAQFNTNYGFNVGERGFINLTGQYQYRGRTDRAGEWTGSVFKTSWDGESPSIYAENFMAGDLSPFDVGQRLTPQGAEQINTANAITNNLTDAQEEALINQNGGRRAFTMQVGQSEAVNAAAMLNSAFEVSENHEFYLFGGISARRGLATGFYRLPNQSRTLTSVYPNGFLPEIGSNIFDASLSGGLRGNVGAWYADFSHTYGSNSFEFLISNTSNASLGNRTPTSFNAGGFRFRQNTTNVDFSRYFEDAMAGINVAFGGEYRVENYEINAGEEGSYRNYGVVNLVDTTADGTPFVNEQSSTNIFYNRPGGSQVFPGFQPANELQQSRSTVAAYADVEFNFTENLFVDAAIRFEDYTDFGSTFNWKLAGRLAATDNFALRAAVSTGFRAPSLPQRYFNNTSTIFTLQNGVNVPNEVGTFRNDSRVAQLFGIPSLTNETSFNLSAGVVWNVADNFDVTVDAYQVDVDDRVVLTSQFDADNSEEIASILSSVNAGSAQLFTNAIDTRTRGIDVIAAYNTSFGESRLKATLAANFTNTEVTNVDIPATLQAAPEAFFDREERGRFEDATPQSKINLLLDYRVNRLVVNLIFVRFGEVFARTQDTETDAQGNDVFIDQRFAPKIITNASVGYNITDAVNLTIGASNLFDVYPDENREEFRSGERFIYSRRASQFGFNGGYYFARLNVTI